MVKHKLSNEEYHADREYLSKSWLDKLAISPAKLKSSLDEPDEQTLAMEIGSMTHAYILEHEEFEKRYAVQPKFDGRTTEGKAQKAVWARQNIGKKPITEDYMEMLQCMKQSVFAHRNAGKLLSDNGEAELSVYAELEGVKCKCRLDWLVMKGIIVDLKTTEDASKTGFSKSVWQYRYMVQHAFYMDICKAACLEITDFIFLAVEKSKPYQVALYKLDDESVNIGRDMYKKQLELYKSCVELDSWPSYGHEIETLSLPKWALKQN